MVRSLEALVVRVERLHTLLELLNGELHLVTLESLPLDEGLLFLVPGRTLHRLRLQPLCFVFRSCELRPQGPLFVSEVVKLLSHGGFLSEDLLGQLKNLLPGLIPLQVLLREVVQAFL